MCNITYKKKDLILEGQVTVLKSIVIVYNATNDFTLKVNGFDQSGNMVAIVNETVIDGNNHAQIIESNGMIPVEAIQVVLGDTENITNIHSIQAISANSVPVQI